MPESGLVGPSYAIQFELQISYRFLYAGGGGFGLDFDDQTPLSQQVKPIGGGRTETHKGKAWVGGGYVELGLMQRVFIALEEPTNGKDQAGIGVLPAVGYGFEGLGTVKREIIALSFGMGYPDWRL